MDASNLRQRLDWELIPPAASDSSDAYATARQVLEASYSLALGAPKDPALAQALTEAELAMEEVSAFKCDVVDAPKVEDDQDWESRVIDEYGESDVTVDLEDYLEARRAEPDCESCPYANRYSVYPMDPCEFSAGGLLKALGAHDSLVARLRSSLAPEQMMAMADDVAGVLAKGQFEDSTVLDTRDYLDQAVQFLRFWARNGFGIRATDLDGDLVTQAQAEMMDDAGPTVH